MVKYCNSEGFTMTIKKIIKLKKREDFIKRLIKYQRGRYSQFSSIFSLQREMLELNICPRCGEYNRVRSTAWGFCPCWTCGFRLTEGEARKILSDGDDISEKTKRRILKKRLMGKMVREDENG
jgi:hypothetical protein